LKEFSSIKPLSNFEIMEKCNELKISNFKAPKMLCEIKGKASTDESLIINLDDCEGPGTHWVCLYNKGSHSKYCDSFGYPPPYQVQRYCSGRDSYYNSFKIQKPDTVLCGHYCIFILYQLNQGIPFEDILHELYMHAHRYEN